MTAPGQSARPRPGQQRLLVLGGNRSNVPSIRSARQAGYFVILADPRPDSPAFDEADLAVVLDVRDCDRLLAALDQYGGVDGIVSTSEAGVEPAAQLSARLGLASITEDAAANARSKAAMRRLWATTGFSTDFFVVDSAQEARDAGRRLGLPLICKPDRSFGGSRGVSRVETLEEMAAAFEFATQGGLPGTRVVVERAVIGTEHSCEVLIHEGEYSVLCIGQKVKSRAPYRVDVSVQYPAALAPDAEARVATMCRVTLPLLGLTRGAAHVEFAYTAEGPVLFEVGARCGGGHTPELAYAASGVEEFIEACRIACGDRPTRVRPVRRAGADYRFLTFPPGRVAAVHVPAEMKEHDQIIDIDVSAQIGDEIRPIMSTSDRIGFVATRGLDRASAVACADWASRQVTIAYDDGRTSPALPLDAHEVS